MADKMCLMSSLSYVGRPVAYYPMLARWLNSVNAAILFAQLHYWLERTTHELGVYKTADELTEETGLSYREQATARKILKDGRYLIETPRRLEHRIYYRLDAEVVNASYERFLKAQVPNDESAIRERRKAQPAAAERETRGETKAQAGAGAKRTSGQNKAAPGEPTKAQSVKTTETTAQTTAETPSVIPPGAGAPVASMIIHAPNGVEHEIPGELRYPGPDTKTHKAWIAYAIAYKGRYQAWPIWNATVAGQIAQFIARVGAEPAPRVAVHYVRRVAEEFIVRQMHPVKLLLADAEKWAAQTSTGQTMTNTRARQADQSQANCDAADEAMAILRAQRQQSEGAANAQ